MNFGSHADAVVGVAAALVNVATPGHRQGRPYAVPKGADLTRALGDATRLGSRRHGDPTRAEAAALLEVGAAARAVFTHAGDARNGSADAAAADAADAAAADAAAAAAAAANDLLARYRPSPRLEHHDGEPWHLHYHGPAADDPSGWGGGVAVALATVLGSEHADRLGVCEAAACDRVFVDVSRNGTRRFCSTACQNRIKAAAHRARVRA